MQKLEYLGPMIFSQLFTNLSMDGHCECIRMTLAITLIFIFISLAKAIRPLLITATFCTLLNEQTLKMVKDYH